MGIKLQKQLNIAVILSVFIVLAMVIGSSKTVSAADTFDFTAKQEQVDFYWGNGAPKGVSPDHFNAKFDQSASFSGNDYFVQTYADDGVEVTVDDKKVISEWHNSSGEQHTAFLPKLSGTHNISTKYFENTGSSQVFSNVVPYDSWLAYYYPNESLSGDPRAAKIINPKEGALEQDFGYNAPAAGLPSDQFSAKYVTYKHIAAGDYILRARADDGVRVYVDNKLVIDRWSNSKYKEDSRLLHISNISQGYPSSDTHKITVEYYDHSSIGKLSFRLDKYNTQISDDSWLATYYPNKSLSGTPYVVGGVYALNPIDKVDFNWGLGSPIEQMPKNNFSASFKRNIKTNAGLYKITAEADDGVRVKIDGKYVINSWETSNSGIRSVSKMLTAGTHSVEVDYFEASGAAELKFTMNQDADFSKIQPQVSYDWGYGSPAKSISANHFSALFNQTQTLSAGDYFIQTFADDRVAVNFDNRSVIDRWTPSSGVINRAFVTGVSTGTHKMTTNFYEDTGVATVHSNIIKFNDWLAYYYPNKNLDGDPKLSKVINEKNGGLYEDFGYDSPGKDLPVNDFSAKYITYKHIKAGTYILRARADDGVRVYIDGKKIIDRWTNSSYQENAVKINISDDTNSETSFPDVHQIRVDYYDHTSIGKVDVELQNYNEQKLDDQWFAEFYPNKSLSGIAVTMGGKDSMNQIKDLDFKWGLDSPAAGIPKNDFSARFEKTIDIANSGRYKINVSADDGVRVFIDGKKVINSWETSNSGTRSAVADLTRGKHKVRIEYFEATGAASIDFNYSLHFDLSKSIDNVNYYWGTGSPGNNIPSDHFSALFDQSQTFESGDYFLQTFADDQIKVEMNGKTIIDNWDENSNQVSRKILTNISGSQNIKTYYYENTGLASIYSDFVPFGSWLAYYYPNEDLSGTPVGAEVIAGQAGNLNKDYGAGSPKGLPADHFSAEYTTARHLSEGDYVLRARADDGVRVLVDGKTVIDHWTPSKYGENAAKIHVSNQNGSDIHWITVQYFEATGAAKVGLEIDNYDSEIPNNSWLAEIYPNESFSGNSIVWGGKSALDKLDDFQFDWEAGSPDKEIPDDHFSIRLTNNFYANHTGQYEVNINADDGVKVLVDGELKYNIWTGHANDDMSISFNLTQGYHKIEIDYHEITGHAKLFAEIKPGIEVITTSTHYDYSLDQFLDYQLGQNPPPQTDANYDAYIYHSGIDVSGDTGIVTGTYNVRGGAGTENWVLGQLQKGDKVTVLDQVKDNDGDMWYKIDYRETWVNARPSDVAYYLNPKNFFNMEYGKYQFLKLSISASLNPEEVNQKILSNSGILTGHAQDFIDAGTMLNINEIYLISHALLETGGGTSELATGVCYNPSIADIDADCSSGTKVYNMYGYGAYDGSALLSGARTAYENGWTNPRKAIIGGAQFIDSGYVSSGQDTLYKMKWNPGYLNDNHSYPHQYATDMGWAMKQTYRMKKLYDLLDGYTQIFEIPEFN